MPNLPSDYKQQEAYYKSDAYRSSLNKDGIGTTYETVKKREEIEKNREEGYSCLLYTSDAADDSLRVDLGGRRIIKKTKTYNISSNT